MTAEARNVAILWDGLQREIAAGTDAFQSEIDATANGLALLIDGQQAAFTLDAGDGGQGHLEQLRRLLSETGDRLLISPVDGYRTLRPQERALAALENYESRLEDLIRRLPRTVRVNGPELLASLPADSGSRLGRYLLARRRSPFQAPVRSVVEGCLARERRARLDALGRHFLALAKISLLLVGPWQAARQEILRCSSEPGGTPNDLEPIRTLWMDRLQQLQAEERQAVEALSRSGAELSAKLANALVSPGRTPSQRRQQRWLRTYRESVRYWSRQQRAVRGVLDLEYELARAALSVTRFGEAAVDSIELERRALLHELDGVTAWLEAAKHGEEGGGFPPPQAALLSGEDRAGEWARSVRAVAERHVPALVETVEPRYALPSWRSPWRVLEPRGVFLSAVADFGVEPVRAVCGEAEATHRSVVREIERAREVVRFSQEAASKDDATGKQVIAEGLTNALALVSFRRQAAARPHDPVESRIAAATCAVISRTHSELDQGRLGVLAHLVEHRGARLLGNGWRLGLRTMSAAGRLVGDAARTTYHRLLQSAGWEAPGQIAAAPVVAQTHLGNVLYLRPPVRELPMIYQRLFRLAPVEEPRFLVGREPELGAVAQARKLWDARRFVSVLVVGARGSGKTSLLNCVATGEFRDAAVVRGHFHSRITRASEMRSFLHDLFGLAPEDDLAAWLTARPRVVILEETERSFLRTVNGFDGLRELLSVISATGRTTLWILSLNQHSFRYLDAAVELSRHFTHRINAMAVPPGDLRKAILLRHYLSGLRLEYPPLPQSDPRASRMRRLLGLEQSPESRFFESLYRQSEGVFRSAFELWQNYMDRVEGGVLYMRDPLEPDFDQMIGQLGLDDALALKAVLQHGSLTAEEHAQIFDCPAEISRIQMERLAGLEYLEPEPSSAGLRIRPEAGRLVHMALHRRNLI